MLTKINPANTHQNIPANAHHNIATNRGVQPYMVIAVMVHIIRPYMVGIWYGSCYAIWPYNMVMQNIDSIYGRI